MLRNLQKIQRSIWIRMNSETMGAIWMRTNNYFYVMMVVVLLAKNPFSSIQSLSRVRVFVTPWITARQASLSITNSRSSLRLKSVESVMSSSHLILWHPLLLLPSKPPSIRVFSNESALLMRWPNDLWKPQVEFFFLLITSSMRWSWTPDS